MPVFAAGLTLNLLGAVFLFLSTPADFAGGELEDVPDEEEPGARGEVWRPDQDIEGVFEWLRSRNKRKFGFLLLSVGFALQLLGFMLPGSRYVM